MNDQVIDQTPEPQTPLVIDHGETRTVDEVQQPVPEGPSELEQHKRARGYTKAPENAAPVEQPAVEAPKPDAKTETKPERWQDPDTGDHYDMRHKVARRIKTVTEERANLRKENATLRQQLDEITRTLMDRGMPKAEAKQEAAATVNQDAEPDPGDLQKYPEGQFDKGFIRDYAKWSATQATKEQLTAASREQEMTRRRAAHNARIAQWNAEVLPKAYEKFGQEAFVDALSRIPNTPENIPIIQMMMGSPVGSEAVMILATNPDAMAAYQRAPGQEGKLRMLYHLEARLMAQQATPASLTHPATTKAPLPTTPVHTGSATAQTIDWSRSDDPDQLTKWKAQRVNRR